MAIFDQQGMFSDGQAITATAASTDAIDLGVSDIPANHTFAVAGDNGASCIPIDIVVTEAFNNLTSLAVSVEMDDNTGFSSATTIFTTPAVVLASLRVGYRFRQLVELPEGLTERYVRLRYTVVGTAPTTGKVTAGVVTGRAAGIV